MILVMPGHVCRKNGALTVVQAAPPKVAARRLRDQPGRAERASILQALALLVAYQTNEALKGCIEEVSPGVARGAAGSWGRSLLRCVHRCRRLKCAEQRHDERSDGHAGPMWLD